MNLGGESNIRIDLCDVRQFCDFRSCAFIQRTRRANLRLSSGRGASEIGEAVLGAHQNRIE